MLQEFKTLTMNNPDNHQVAQRYTDNKITDLKSTLMEQMEENRLLVSGTQK